MLFVCGSGSGCWSASRMSTPDKRHEPKSTAHTVSARVVVEGIAAAVATAASAAALAAAVAVLEAFASTSLLFPFPFAVPFPFPAATVAAVAATATFVVDDGDDNDGKAFASSKRMIAVENTSARAACKERVAHACASNRVASSAAAAAAEANESC